MWNRSLRQPFLGILVTFWIAWFDFSRPGSLLSSLGQLQRGPPAPLQLSNMVVCALMAYLRKCREIKVYKLILTFLNVLGSLGRSVNSTLTLEYGEKSLSLLCAVGTCPGFQMDWVCRACVKGCGQDVVLWQ